MGVSASFGASVGSISSIQRPLQTSPQAGLHGDSAAFTNNVSAYHVPPVETRSWFHTGVYFDENSSHLFDYRELTRALRHEFYQGDTQAVPLDEHAVETGETPHEAYRALRGALLRARSVRA